MLKSTLHNWRRLAGRAVLSAFLAIDAPPQLQLTPCLPDFSRRCQEQPVLPGLTAIIRQWTMTPSTGHPVASAACRNKASAFASRCSSPRA